MAEANKLPVKAEKKPPAPAPVGHLAPFESLRREIDRLFERFHEGAWRFSFGRPVFDLELSWPRGAEWAIAPAVDVAEKDKEYEITAELPGMDAKDIEIKLSSGTVTIRGEKKEGKEEREKNYYLSERCYGSFTRTFQVPEGVETAKIEAAFANGVLTLKLPKTAEAQKAEKTIPIKGA